MATCRHAGNVRYNGRCTKIHATVEASFVQPRARQGTAMHAKKNNDLVDVEVVFDGLEDEDDLGLGSSPATLSWTRQALGSFGVIADQLTEAAMQFVPEGTSFEVVRVAVVGGIVLVILSFVKGLLSLALTIGTVGVGAYTYTRVYGGAGSEGRMSGPRSRSAKGSRRKTTKKTAKSKAASSVGGLLSSIVDSTVSRDIDDGLLDVTFKKQSKRSRSNKPKRK